MGRLKLYIAVSLDGKITREDGSVDWLEGAPNPSQTDFGYAEFMEGIGTVIMGNGSYKKVLSFGIPFPYADKQNFVFTRDASLDQDENVRYISGDMLEFVRELKTAEEQDIWLMGGAQVITQLLAVDLVDDLWVFVMPIMLGAGIDLLNGPLPDRYWELVESKPFPGGAVQLTYRKS